MLHHLLFVALAYASAPVITQTTTVAPTPQKTDAQIRQEFAQYAATCREKVGEVPPFSCDRAQDANTVRFSEVPITQDGRPVTGKQPTCDDPSWIDPPCESGQKLIELRSVRESVKTVAVCRPRKDGTVVGIIQHDSKTGDTCFFDITVKSGVSVPSPTSPEGNTSYRPLQDLAGAGGDPSKRGMQECIACHDSDPWIHNRFLDRVDWFPKIANAKGPYNVVGARIRPLWQPTFAPVGKVLQDGKLQVNACTSCHRIGVGETCQRFLGLTSHPTNTGIVGRGIDQPPTMPEGHGLTRAQWDHRYGEHLAQTKACCEAGRQRFWAPNIRLPLPLQGYCDPVGYAAWLRCRARGAPAVESDGTCRCHEGTRLNGTQTCEEAVPMAQKVVATKTKQCLDKFAVGYDERSGACTCDDKLSFPIANVDRESCIDATKSAGEAVNRRIEQATAFLAQPATAPNATPRAGH